MELNPCGRAPWKQELAHTHNTILSPGTICKHSLLDVCFVKTGHVGLNSCLGAYAQVPEMCLSFIYGSVYGVGLDNSKFEKFACI